MRWLFEGFMRDKFSALIVRLTSGNCTCWTVIPLGALHRKISGAVRYMVHCRDFVFLWSLSAAPRVLILGWILIRRFFRDMPTFIGILTTETTDETERSKMEILLQQFSRLEHRPASDAGVTQPSSLKTNVFGLSSECLRLSYFPCTDGDRTGNEKMRKAMMWLPFQKLGNFSCATSGRLCGYVCVS